MPVSLGDDTNVTPEGWSVLDAGMKGSETVGVNSLIEGHSSQSIEYRASVASHRNSTEKGEISRTESNANMDVSLW
jgi:hypothetical protein